MSKNTFKPDNEHLKCAPSKKIDAKNNTCFTTDQLIKMVKSYNKHIKNKDKEIKLEKLQTLTEPEIKKYLLSKLIDKLPNTCKSQECLLKEEFVHILNDFDLLYNTLRPLGPIKKYKWLSSSDINQIMVQYTFKYPEFKFFGALPIDFEIIELPVNYKTNVFYKTLCNMYKKNIYKIGFVLNLDNHTQSGSHWVALYANLKDKQIYFFDSYGYIPDLEIIKLMSIIAYWINFNNCNSKKKHDLQDYSLDFVNGICNKYSDIDIKYNNIRHQYKNSECGVYSVYFIIKLLLNNTFNDIINDNIPDDEINKCRKTYFRFE
jgi:Ulp1 family protease